MAPAVLADVPPPQHTRGAREKRLAIPNAERFIHETCTRQRIAREQLTIHADRGSAMTSKSVAFLLGDLGITKTHSGPHVSNDNPFSEAQFKTLKYRPDFPTRFGSIQDVRAHCHVFFPWYNVAHHHSGLGLLTPHDVHYGLADQRVAARATVLATAYAIHPERFPAGLSRPPARPEAVWINPPKRPAAAETRGLAATRDGVLDHARPGPVFSAHHFDLDRRGCCVEAPA